MSKDDELMFSVADTSRGIKNVNGIICELELENNIYFDVFEKSIIDGKPITLVLNMNLRNPNYIDLKKTKIKIPKEVLGELFKKLKDSGVVLYLTRSPSVKDIDFEEIGAIDFVKSCLKFRDLYGAFLTLDEIKEMGKEPIVVDIEFIEDFKDVFIDLWKKQRLHPLSGRGYKDFLMMTCQRVSKYFFERCEECENKGNNCVFKLLFKKWEGYYIANSDFKDLCLKKGLVRIENRFILDNLFVNAICEMWKSNKITSDEIRPIFKGINKILNRKDYVTLEDIEELASKNEDIKKSYELIKKWIENYGKIEKQ